MEALFHNTVYIFSDIQVKGLAIAIWNKSRARNNLTKWLSCRKVNLEKYRLLRLQFKFTNGKSPCQYFMQPM